MNAVIHPNIQHASRAYSTDCLSMLRASRCPTGMIPLLHFPNWLSDCRWTHFSSLLCSPQQGSWASDCRRCSSPTRACPRRACRCCCSRTAPAAARAPVWGQSLLQYLLSLHEHRLLSQLEYNVASHRPCWHDVRWAALLYVTPQA